MERHWRHGPGPSSQNEPVGDVAGPSALQERPSDSNSRPLILVAANRLVDALSDPTTRERNALLAIAGYAGLWTLYATISQSSRDIPFDMGEVVAWSRELARGNPKHPPGSAWLVKAWFSVFPLADWAYYLLAIIVAATGLWLAWRLSCRWLAAEKRVAALALLTFVPFYNFHAMKYNANIVLIPLWAATTLCFIRAFETRSLVWSALTGLSAAGAMLGKYWSVTLLAGLAIAAVADARRRTYFRSAASWVTAAVGLVVLSPHLLWLYEHRFEPLRYAAYVHVSSNPLDVGRGVAKFILGNVGYVAAPVALAFAATRPGRAAIGDLLWPADNERRLPVVAFWAPFAAAIATAILTSTEIVSLWSIPAMTLLGVVLLSSPRITLRRQRLVLLVAVAVILPFLMLAASPVVAIVEHLAGAPDAAHYRLLAETIERSWRNATSEPLRLVSANPSVAFYLPGEPSTFNVHFPSQTPWANPERVAHEGVAIVCPVEEIDCVLAARHIAGPAARDEGTEIEISRRFLGIPGRPARYFLLILPPHSQARRG